MNAGAATMGDVLAIGLGIGAFYAMLLMWVIDSAKRDIIKALELDERIEALKQKGHNP